MPAAGGGGPGTVPAGGRGGIGPEYMNVNTD